MGTTTDISVKRFQVLWIISTMTAVTNKCHRNKSMFLRYNVHKTMSF